MMKLPAVYGLLCINKSATASVLAVAVHPLATLCQRLALTKRQVTSMNHVHPKKLLLTKWTAVQPVLKEKHFLVLCVVLPEPPDTKVEFVDLEAIHSKSVRRIAWRDLRDQAHWRQGWV